MERSSTTKKPRRQRAYSSGSSSESEVDGRVTARDAPIKDTSVKSAKRQDAKPKPAPQEPGQRNNERTARPKSSHQTVPLNPEPEGPSNAEEQGSEEASSSAATSDESDNEDDEQDGTARRKTKRRDPEKFATSLAAILSSKLPTTKRQDPVLARSRDAEQANLEISEGRLEAKAKRKLREEKRQAKERGHVKDILLGERASIPTATLETPAAETPDMSAAEIAEQERRLRKTAQRGVVKLFNAVRAAQVRTEQATKAVRAKGVVGHQQREEKVGEMGRQAFLDMVSAGGKAKAGA